MEIPGEWSSETTIPAPIPRRDTEKQTQTNSSSVISALDMGISDEEWDRLQKALDWPGPDQQITQLNLSTSPVHSTFSIVELKKSYKVGENISVSITARDHNKNLKTYGGDFFKAKLIDSKLKVCFILYYEQFLKISIHTFIILSFICLLKVQ